MPLPRRSEIARELTWDLSHLFADPEDYERSFAQLLEEIPRFAARYEGRIAREKEASALLEALRAFEALCVARDRCGSYVMLAQSVDYGDRENGERALRYASLGAPEFAKLSFFENELKRVDAAVLKDLAERAPAYAALVRDLIEDAPHTLSPAEEKLLAEFSPLFALPENVYQQTKLADMRFPDFTADGKTRPLSFVLYENNYCSDRRTETRRAAFRSFSETLKGHENAIATAYFAQVQGEKILSRLCGYASVTDMLLARQRATREMYERQIDLIMTELAPHMRRWAEILRRHYKLDEMRYSDLKLVLDPDYAPKTDIPQAERYARESLAVLGETYSAIVAKAFAERRLDYAQNEGKSTGGFCASPYRKGGYILLNWSGELSEVFTLVHELGHLAHFTLAQEAQPILASECSLYQVEAPSTCNELLLTRHLLEQKPGDLRFRRWVLASMVANTYYHNFVTHLLEAAYQREVYRALDAGKALQADDFSAIFREVLRAFWGEAVTLDEGSELTWMRQPHYYNGLYPYTYSAGLTIATVLSRRIFEEGRPAVEDWLRTLRAGGTLRPLEFAASAGVAIDTDAALRETIAYIGALIEEIEQLSARLGD